MTIFLGPVEFWRGQLFKNFTGPPHENWAKNRSNNRKMDRFTTNLEKVTRKLVVTIKLYHTLAIWKTWINSDIKYFFYCFYQCEYCDRSFITLIKTCILIFGSNVLFENKMISWILISSLHFVYNFCWYFCRKVMMIIWKFWK
jgi:hypothetical protein